MRRFFTKTKFIFFFGIGFVVICTLIFLFFWKYISNIIGIYIGVVTCLIATWIYYLVNRKTDKSQNVNINSMEFLDLKSWLTRKRTIEIIRQYEVYYPIFQKKRLKYLRNNSAIKANLIKKDKLYKEKPAWYSISSTNSAKKYRLTLGFRNIGCAYWRENKNKIGCLNCGFGSSAIPDLKVTKEDLLKQFSYVRKWAYLYRYDFDVIEFLNDGSFLNFENEWPEGFPVSLFKLISSDKSIVRILIESRPEYITKNKIQSLLETLRKDQILEVGVGLESSDDFIRTVCIHKGYNKDDFEKCVKLLSSFKMITVVVYSIIKPNFLTEIESIEDILQTSKYISEIESQYKIKIVHKLEPVVVSQGTLLDILHFNPISEADRYTLLSYWSVIEIICRIYLYDNTRLLRIGAREDMDIIERVSGIYNPDGTFNQYDFWCYDTIQKYNADNDFIQFISNIYLIIENDDSFHKWQVENGIEDSAIDECIRKYSLEIQHNKQTPFQSEHEKYFRSVFRVLDELESTESSQLFASKFRKEHQYFSEEGIKQLDDFITQKFTSAIPNTQIVVNNYYHEKTMRKILRIYFDLINFENQEKHYIWIGIPTIN